MTKFKEGDLVQRVCHGAPQEFGLVATIFKSGKFLYYELRHDYFLEGYQEPDPSLGHIYEDVKEGTKFHKLSRNEIIELLRKKKDDLWYSGNPYNQSGILLTHRVRYNIDSMIKDLSSNSRPDIVIKKKFPQPKSGCYVIQGKYAGVRLNADSYVSRLIVKPRLSEEAVSELLETICPNGTGGNIPQRCNGVQLHGYTVYEVPAEAEEITDSIVLEVNVRN